MRSVSLELQSVQCSLCLSHTGREASGTICICACITTPIQGLCALPDVALPGRQPVGTHEHAAADPSVELKPCKCRLPHVCSSSTLSPSASPNLSHFGGSDFCMSPGAQLTSPLGSGLSCNSTSTSLGLSYVSSPPQQGLAWRPCHDSPASAAQPWGPNPMLAHDWLPQHPSLAAQLSQIRSERQRPGIVPVDVLEGIWGFDDFLPEPGKHISIVS